MKKFILILLLLSSINCVHQKIQTIESKKTEGQALMEYVIAHPNRKITVNEDVMAQLPANIPYPLLQKIRRNVIVSEAPLMLKFGEDDK